MRHIVRLRGVFVLAVLATATAAFAAPAHAQARDWREFLRRDAIEAIEISPDGKHIAIAQRTEQGTDVSIREVSTLQETQRFDPGNLGEIALLRWVDDERLLIGANRADTRYRIALVEPALYVVSRDGRTKDRMPVNYLASIVDDPEHLLVTRCGKYADGGCIDEVRKVQLGHTSKTGELVIAAPDGRSSLIADQHGNVRFALAWDKESRSKLQVHRGNQEGWSVVNDASVSGVDSIPLGVDATGANAYLLTERKEGTSIVERYSIADGKREQVYADPDVDPIWAIRSLDGSAVIGAYFDPTRPRAVLWDAGHPDVPALRQILGAFPGKLVAVTSASRDRNLAVVHVSADDNPGEYYLFDRAARRATLLARSQPWMQGRSLPHSQAITLQARDGLPLHGLLTLPPGGARKALPMVVLVHGGPYEVTETWGYDAESALLADHGYAVLRVNFRGSGGYGNAFIEKGFRQWGRAMQDDVSDATRWAIQQGYADGAKVCIYGMSYGGYAALMGAVREPALYRCVAGYAAPYDLAKMYKWGSIRRSDLGLEYLERVLGKDKEELAAHSPAQRADAIKVPVLLAHGRLDARVDVRHSQQLAKALRKAGTPIELVEYPNEGHGLAIDADREDFYAKLLAFFDRHLRSAQ